jgi:alcohol dehydrogenase class IV
MRFEFATATRIIFGQGTIHEIAQLATEMGSHAFIVTGRTSKRAEPVLKQLNRHKIKYVI